MPNEQPIPCCPECSYPMAYDFWALRWVCVYAPRVSVSTVPHV